MKSRWLLWALVATLVMTAEASAYRRYGRRSGGYGGFGISMNLSPTNFSQAAINYQQAYQLWIQNQKLREQTYFDMRRMNASYRAEQEMQHPQATPEQIEAFNQARLPAPLSANTFDPAHGVIEWPPVLTRSEFDGPRHQLEGLFSQAAADPHGSGLGTQNYRDIQQSVAEMSDKLHFEMKQFGPDEYIAASKFLKSLAFEARKPSSDTVATK